MALPSFIVGGAHRKRVRRLSGHTFIDVDPEFVPSVIGSAVNPNTVPGLRFIQRMLTRLRHYRPAQVLPEGLRKPLAAIRKTISRFNTVQDRYPPLSPALRAALIDRFRGRTSRMWRTCCMSP